jgi:hypothetical protein
MLDFAMKVCLRSHEIEEADFEALARTASTTRTSGTSRAITAFFGCPTAWPIIDLDAAVRTSSTCSVRVSPRELTLQRTR